MIIIVEGIDRVGKTTLCKMLELKTGYKRFRDDFRYVKMYNDIKVNTEKINTLQNLIENRLVDNVILDRYIYTEYVYGVVDRGYINTDMLDMVSRLKLMEDNVIIIYVKPTDLTLSSKEHGKDLSLHNFLMDLCFDEDSKVITCDYESLNVAVEKVEEIIKNKGAKDSEK